MVFASLRIGLYEPVKNAIVGPDHKGPISIFTRILAALATGAFGIMVANPTDVVKIRFQGEGKKPEHERRYRTVTEAYRKIVAEEGYFFILMQYCRTLDRFGTQHYQKFYHQRSRNRNFRPSQRHDLEKQVDGRWYSLPFGFISNRRYYSLYRGIACWCSKDETYECQSRVIHRSDWLYC